MGAVELKVEDLLRGDVPAVSVKTGKPCSNPVGVILRPGSRLWRFYNTKVYGVLPMEPRRVRLRLALLWSAWLSLFLIPFGLLWVPMFVIGIGVYVTLVIAGNLVWVGSRRGASDDTVVVTRVHPGFVAAASR
jgi:hypothetical protein